MILLNSKEKQIKVLNQNCLRTMIGAVIGNFLYSIFTVFNFYQSHVRGHLLPFVFICAGELPDSACCPQVRSMMERVIVFLLSQVVERSPQEEALFSLHPRTESCKLLWRDSQAVGFYTIKHKGSLCDSWSGRCYLLPVLDTVLVRRSWRRRGLGLQMLEDFCSSFSTEEFLGVSSPLSPSMAAVCRRFLQQHEEHRDRLYEVEAPGGWTQRQNIWLNIQLGRYSPSINEESSSTLGETVRSEADHHL
uniref:Family with sequence similarity 169 member B n=1 Tax=Seriola lalandi dorsalis TaxID=1841481 RepID=A0A3B4Y5X4_SERLL